MEMLVFGIAAAVSYWYETEVFLFLGSAYVTCRFLYKWYMPLLETWPPEHGETGRRVLGCLPPVSLAIILFVLLTMASYDVVGIWVVFYILMGYAWICGGVLPNGNTSGSAATVYSGLGAVPDLVKWFSPVHNSQLQ